MSQGSKALLIIFLTPLVILVLFSVIWDANWFRGQAEPHLEDIEGHNIDFVNLEHSLYSPGHLEVQDITVRGPITNGKIGTLVLDMNIFDALQKDIYINEVILKNTDLKVDMAAYLASLEQETETGAVDVNAEDGNAEDGVDVDIRVETDESSEQLPVKSIYIAKIGIENAKIEDVSSLNQFLIAGLSVVLTDINIAQDAQIIVGSEKHPIDIKLAIEQLQAMSSPVGTLHADIAATAPLVTIESVDLKMGQSAISLNGTVKELHENHEIQLSLNDTKIVIDEFKSLIPEDVLADLPVEPKGELNMRGNLKMEQKAGEEENILNQVESDITVLLDTGESKVDAAAKLVSTDGIGNVQLTINDSYLQLEEFQALMTESPVKPSGLVNVSGLINANGAMADSDALMASLAGDVAISMDNGKLQGINVNELVSGFKESKETDLIDVGSFLITGPVGILASNLFDLGAGATQMEGETTINQLRVNGKMEGGSINLHNTALSTDEFRLAFDGAVNPEAQTFEDFIFAILDEKGCADIKQTLNGEMANPTSAVAKSLLDSAIAPVTGLIDSVTNTISECEPFYTGEVAHPM